MNLIPCFVLSLPDCLDRRSTISGSLRDIDLSFEFFDAVDGRNGLDDDSERQIDREAARRAGAHMSDAEFACALSHINIYRKIIADAIPYTLILEDDVTVDPSLIDFLSGKHYQDADLTQIYSSPKGCYVRRGGVNSFRVGTDRMCVLRRSHVVAPVAM
ncbi:MAG: glycosyltransferase family 25 protein [Aestuariivita sp.]|nr:glycosyltransferase family 25 protein [Aestuariivita sp.]